MEKKKYITPECEVVEMETVTVIAGSTPEVGEDKETGGGDDTAANRHRGEWGNLWSDFGK
jgi:hypothetical protein